MAGRSDRDYEVNEVSWWSNWATATWLTDDAFVLRSKDFDEAFFNRGGVLSPPDDPSRVLSRAERLFRLSGREPCFFVQDSRPYGDLRRALKERGYRSVEQMSVMELVSPSLRANPEVGVREVSSDDFQKWARTYLLSFYGEAGLLRATLGAVRRAVRRGGVTLLLAEHGRRPVGTLAAYRSDGEVGAYCIGTVPELRNRGVARTLLESVHQVAKTEGRKTILQTIISDSVEPLYVKLGFKRIYLKDSYAKPL